MTRTETARVEACDAPGIERILRGGWATDFTAVLLAHEVPALCTLDEALRDRPVTRFLVYKLFAHCNVYTIQTYCGEKSAEYEASRAARTLLAGAARETGTNMRLHLNKKRDELVLPTGCAGSASSEAPYAIADYDVMNSVALRFEDCKLGTTWFSLMKLLVDLDALGLGQDADKDMLCTALAERVEGAQGDSARIATLFRDERKVIVERLGAQPRVHQAQIYEALAHYTNLTHTIGNFGLIPFGHPGTRRTFNPWKGCGGVTGDRQDYFLEALRNAWGTFTWKLSDGSEVPCAEVMSFPDYIRAAQLGLYCVGREVVETFLDAARHEDADGIIAAYAHVEQACTNIPVDLDEEFPSEPAGVAHLKGATLRIEARGRLIMARYRHCQRQSI